MAQRMRAFEIHLNGKKLCIAGMPKGIVSVSMKWVARPRHSDEIGGFDVGGLIHSTNQHVKWAGRQLHIGDELRIKLIEKTAVDRPRKVKRQAST